MRKVWYNLSCSAGVAHPVERHLAKVEVASSSLVTRSIKKKQMQSICFFFIVRRRRLERLNLTCRGQVSREGLTERYNYFHFLWK